MFGADAGIVGGLIVGAMFSAGMICTDTLDSVLVHRLISYRSERLPALMRVWILCVTVLAVVVVAYQLAQILGWRSPVSDLIVSAALVTALVLVFGYVFVHTLEPRRQQLEQQRREAQRPEGNLSDRGVMPISPRRRRVADPRPRR